MFNGVIYNQGKIKSIKKSPKYVSGSLVIEIESNLRFNKKDIGGQFVVMGYVLL